jgi:hypothetical protein
MRAKEDEKMTPTCKVVTGTGFMCGGSLPCQYHMPPCEHKITQSVQEWLEEDPPKDFGTEPDRLNAAKELIRQVLTGADILTDRRWMRAAKRLVDET